MVANARRRLAYWAVGGALGAFLAGLIVFVTLIGESA